MAQTNGFLLSARRIWLLLWKNFVLRRRHYVITAFEIILPTIMAAALVYLKSETNGENAPPPSEIIGGQRVFPEYNEQIVFSTVICPFCPVFFAPNNTLTAGIVEKYINLTCEFAPSDPWCAPELIGDIALGFDSEESIEFYLLDEELNTPYRYPRAVFIFDEGFEDLDFPPNHKFHYKLRHQFAHFQTGGTDELIPWFQEPGPNSDNAYAYYNSGYLSMQFRIEKAIIRYITGDDMPDHEYVMQAFPYPQYAGVSNFNDLYFLLMPQFLNLGFVFIVPALVRTIVSEKATGIKELMKMMGLPNWMHWFGWMLNSMIMWVFSITIVIVIFFVGFDSAGPFVAFGDPTLWWFVFFVYGLSITSFIFCMTAFFEKPAVATTVGIMVYFVSYNALAQTIDANGGTYQDLSLGEKMAACLIPNMGLHLALKVMGGFEGNAVGAQWSNFFGTPSTVDTLSVGHCCLMMFLDCILYMLLAVYFESIIPSKYGVRKPWYYIFLPSTYMCGNKQSDQTTSAEGSNIGKKGFETEPPGLKAGIVVKNLKKVYGNNKMAVNDISFKMFDGQITALLGHNGAGKTTTMSILTGMFAPSGGTAIINGFDINKDMDSIRANLGLCPQHNMLFDRLTVEEHLIFFGRLKGMTASAAHADMKDLLDKLQLKEKRHVLSMSLSGGQKRKLSLGMALIGGTKVVILDEPTSGMDPEARRVIWDILLKMRGERTILLTTHFMEEADILGDRIAIMSEGQLQCCGTPMFLKQYYGAGYSLKMTIDPQSPVQLILQSVQRYIPDAFMTSENTPSAHEISITIPNNNGVTASFPQMFADLSKNKDYFHILTIGISLTTMDEVFIKAGEQFDVEHKRSNGMKSVASSASLRNHQDRKSANAFRLTGFGLFFQQFYGLFLKKIIYTTRKYRLFLIQFILPILLTIAAILLSNNSLVSTDSKPPLRMKLSDYKEPKTFYATTSDPEAKDVADKFASYVGAISVDGDIVQALLADAKEDLGAYRARHIVAASFNETTAKAMFSTIPNHAAPLALNLVSNALLQSAGDKCKDCSIDMTIHPLKSFLDMDDALADTPDSATTSAILFGVFIPIGLAFVAASYIIHPVEERLCKAKQLQLMSGVSPVLYWTANLLWDFLLMVIVVGLMVAIFPILEKNQAFTVGGGVGVLILMFLAYGFAAISFSYFFSLFVGTVVGGFSIVVLMHILSGMMFSMTTFFMEHNGSEDKIYPLRIIGSIFPAFTMSTSLMKYTVMASDNGRCSSIKQSTLDLICQDGFGSGNANVERGQACCHNCADIDGIECFKLKPYLTWDHRYNPSYDTVPGILQDITIMFGLGVAYFLLVQIIEYRHIVIGFIRSRMRNSTASSTVFHEMSEDTDVKAESQRVRELVSSGRVEDEALIASDLCKNFGSLAAVSKLSFGVHHGECFGLLGVNGAGKTTTFRMLTGDESTTSGNAYGHASTLLNSRGRFLSNIGYCPQFDGIVDVLSGRQMLQLFSRLRGIPRHMTDFEADRWLHELGLEESGDVQCQKYSGGMKRRLSAAMALVGDLPLIMLDEPTSGVDPVARRQFWKVIESLRGSGQAVILTSHSMEECESLCSRLGIMVNGQFQCLGGVQHLKNKFAQGFSLQIKLRPNIPYDAPEIGILNNEICGKFHPCVLKDRHQNVLKYQIYNTGMPWDVLFSTMEGFQSQFKSLVEDYSVSETSLEEVFLSFARKQYPDRIADLSLLRKVLTCKC